MLDKILVPVDESDHSRKAAKYAFEIAQRFNSKIKIFHTIPGQKPLYMRSIDLSKAKEELKREARELISKYENMAKRHNLEVESEYSFGSTPSKEIIKEVKENGFDQIIMGSKGESGIKSLGSVANKVVKHSNCSITIIR